MMQLVTLAMLLLLTTPALSAPTEYEDYSVVIPQKRAALVLDRLLVALSKALHEDQLKMEESNLVDSEGPRVAPLRVPNIDTIDMSALQRRGQAGSAAGRGRVLRCYFNAVTCF